jgi:serine beta-lactamase-like protein LACTB
MRLPWASSSRRRPSCGWRSKGGWSSRRPWARYLPDAPAAWSPITLEHLLTHTSGIDNLWNDPSFQHREREDLSPDQLTAVAAAKPLLYAPGTGFTYASVNYTVLARVIERVTGQPYAAYLEAQFFKPIGMTRTTFDEAPRVVHGLVQPYVEGPLPAPFFSPKHAFGGGSFYSTAEDLARWTLALQGGKVLNPESLRRMDTAYHLKDGRNTHYGYGIRPHGTLKDPYLQSNGDIPGFHTEVVYQPKEGVFVAILTNTEDLDSNLDSIAKRVAALAGGRPRVEPKAAPLSAAELARFCGRYADGAAVRTIRLHQGRLVSVFPNSSGWALTPLSPTECFFDTDPDLRLRFELKDGVFSRVQLVREDRFPGPTYSRMP